MMFGIPNRLKLLANIVPTTSGLYSCTEHSTNQIKHCFSDLSFDVPRHPSYYPYLAAKDFHSVYSDNVVFT